MTYDLDSVLATVRASREFFLKHLKGVREEQWDWKPYPRCKSIRETLAHLIMDDRVCLARFVSGDKPDHEALEVHETDIKKLLELLTESHKEYCRGVQEMFTGTPLTQIVPFFMGDVPLAEAIQGISQENYYHAGQVAFIRLATDPSWRYYAEVYGW